MAMCKFDVEQVRREILLGGKGRRSHSEQGPPPGTTSHLWGNSSGRRSPWCKKRTSAPQMGPAPQRPYLVLRSRRSWPVAPYATRRFHRREEEGSRREWGRIKGRKREERGEKGEEEEDKVREKEEERKRKKGRRMRREGKKKRKEEKRKRMGEKGKRKEDNRKEEREREGSGEQEDRKKKRRIRRR
ncbi:hypothetical protein LSTR_LSTR012118 [Laodelphax striatellus]|uniref:Uncharacterized protein n=1 Tax=Laodelphax striatellus TaxID=195883 RepID=A0A482WYS6_LAOST|nr:hypothetical protein LSTR_LSTR012118 [Laodelphax striatellus]